MIETIQLEDRAVEVHDAPKLLVEWPSRWQEFCSSIGPALAKSNARHDGESPFGLKPYRIKVTSYALEAFLIFAAIAIQINFPALRIWQALRQGPRERQAAKRRITIRRPFALRAADH